VLRRALVTGVVLALATQAAFDGALTFCSMTGELGPGCDCPEAEAPSLESIGCCVRVESCRLDEALPLGARAEAPAPVALAVSAVAALDGAAVPGAARVAHEGDGPRRVPLFLRLRTLVI